MNRAKMWQEKGMLQKEISEKLGCSERTVRNYLKAPAIPKERKKKKSKLDPYREWIKATIKENPYHNCELIFETIVKMGYQGKISILRDYAHALKSQIFTAATIRFETTPGLQAQVDWAEFGSHIVDGRKTKIYAFVMVLGYSRKPYVCFTTSMRSDVLLWCHKKAFEYFGGVPSEILYDNMKTAFIADSTGTFLPQRDLLRCAVHYGFEPKRCRIRRPQTKGKVERAIRFVRDNFWPRINIGEGLCLDDLNTQALEWIEHISGKIIRELGQSRHERFEVERLALRALPDAPFETRREVMCTVSRESNITYETNKYSVPPIYVGKTLVLLVDEATQTAEITDSATSIRVFNLFQNGARRRLFFDEDQKALHIRHREDIARLERLARLQRMPKSHRPPITEVVVRSPKEYESICGEV